MREQNFKGLKEKDHNFKVYQKKKKRYKEGTINKEQDLKNKYEVTV